MQLAGGPAGGGPLPCYTRQNKVKLTVSLLPKMKELGTTRLTADFLTDPRWELAQRVANATNFRNCPKLRAFFLYICENALLGRLENVREQPIGTRVFGRAPDYNLNEDNIVRVEARELRKRLET